MSIFEIRISVFRVQIFELNLFYFEKNLSCVRIVKLSKFTILRNTS